MILFVNVFLVSSIGLFAQLSIPVTATKDVIDEYYSHQNSSEITALKIEDFEKMTISRSMIDIILLLKGLKAGGLTVELDIIETPNAARSRALIENGSVVLSLTTFFSVTFNDNVFTSREVLPRGSFIKGIYGLESNTDLLAVRSLNDLQNYSAVSIPHWQVDWLTLENQNLKELRAVQKYDHIFSQIARRGMDFTILEIADGERHEVTVNGITLIPVPNVLIGLDDSRHFMVSKAHQDGNRVFQALQRGLTILREQGVIEEWISLVVNSDDLKDWRRLN